MLEIVLRRRLLGSASAAGPTRRSIEDGCIGLGCVMPSENRVVFGDALRRLATQATCFCRDGFRYEYDTRPTVMPTVMPTRRLWPVRMPHLSLRLQPPSP